MDDSSVYTLAHALDENKGRSALLLLANLIPSCQPRLLSHVESASLATADVVNSIAVRLEEQERALTALAHRANHLQHTAESMDFELREARDWLVSAFCMAAKLEEELIELSQERDFDHEQRKAAREMFDQEVAKSRTILVSKQQRVEELEQQLASARDQVRQLHADREADRLKLLDSSRSSIEELETRLNKQQSIIAELTARASHFQSVTETRERELSESSMSLMSAVSQTTDLEEKCITLSEKLKLASELRKKDAIRHRRAVQHVEKALEGAKARADKLEEKLKSVIDSTVEQESETNSAHSEQVSTALVVVNSGQALAVDNYINGAGEATVVVKAGKSVIQASQHLNDVKNIEQMLFARDGNAAWNLALANSNGEARFQVLACRVALVKLHYSEVLGSARRIKDSRILTIVFARAAEVALGNLHYPWARTFGRLIQSPDVQSDFFARAAEVALGNLHYPWARTFGRQI